MTERIPKLAATEKRYLKYFKLHALGIPQKQIANAITVNRAIKGLRIKYNCDNNVQLALTLRQKGLI